MKPGTGQNLNYLEQEKKFPRPADLLTISYQLIVLFIIMLHFRAIHNVFYFVVFHILIIIFLCWLAFTDDSPFLKWLKNWNPVLIIPMNYSELHYMVHNVHPRDFDSLLMQIDYRIFGFHPTVWMESWANPWLTEYLQVVYATFYFLPFILVIYLLKKNQIPDFRYFIFVIVLGYYVSYLGYFSVPALGPRFTLDHLQTNPVTGIWLTDILRNTLNRLESIQRDAFPSGHTAVTLLTMYYAWKYSKTYFWILMVVGTSLIFSTLYLRYHYAVDVLAGFIVAGVIVAVAPLLYRKLMELPLLFFKKLIYLSTSTEDEQA
jgi:membrane-associated phospholipid phosphatase